MKTLQKRLYVVLFIGAIGVIVSACAFPPLGAFLGPKPNFQDSTTQSTRAPQGQQLIIPQGQAPYYPSSSPASSSIVQSDMLAGADKIVSQLSETLAEAQAHVDAGEARLKEQNPLEAIREFERARALIEEGVDPSLQYIQQAPQITGGVRILPEPRIQSIQTQHTEMLSRINRSYDFQTLYLKQKESDRLAALRTQNKPILQPVILDRRVTQTRPAEILVEQRPVSFKLSLALPTADLDQYIARFQQRRNEFRECLLRANQYFPRVTSLLSASGVPEDLAYVALIESGFQPSIMVSSGKAGLWQLSNTIARSYGLAVSSNRDERNDIEPATRAFARYISDLRRRFGSWELAILGYEMGEQHLQNTIARMGSSDLQSIQQQLARSAPEGEFLTKLAAAITIAQNPRAYGFDVDLPNLSNQITAQVTKPSISVMTEPPAVASY